MKMRVLLVLSIGFNVALIGAYWATRHTMKPASVPATPTLTNDIARETSERRAPRSAVAGTAPSFHWSTVEAEDYRRYIANLRAIGCPEETIRDIIIADVNKLYGARLAALYPSPQDFKFWKPNDRRSWTDNRERERKERELEREKRSLVKELLGVDLEREMAKWSGRPDDDQRRYGFLSAEKQEQLKALQDKYRELERALGESGGGSNAENRAKITALRAQREAEMAQLLSPQEFEDYQLRNSWTARAMRDSLASFEANESEFRSIFQLKKAFDDQYGLTREGSDEAVREQRRLAQQQLDEQVKTTLGEERYREYQLAQDERYRDLYEFTQRNNLPKETAETVYEMRKVAEAERQRVETDQAILPEQRSAILKVLAEETRKTLAAAFGESNFNNYAQRDGRWIDRLGRSENDRNDNRQNRERSSRRP